MNDTADTVTLTLTPSELATVRLALREAYDGMFDNELDDDAGNVAIVLDRIDSMGVL